MPPQSATSANKATKPVLPWLLALLLLVSTPFACAKNYTDNTDGTVTDPSTGLTWMRCAIGQTWTGSTCSGAARNHNFDEANALTGAVTFAGQSDWRLPNIRELQTLVDWSAYNPAIDSVAFPNTPSTYFWPASTTMVVRFLNGEAYGSAYQFSGGAVRMVRGGTAFGALLGLARPTSDYVDHGDGTVTHTPTNLTWKRCAEGQTWTGSTCSGIHDRYSFSAAQAITGTTAFAGKSDWRLPTAEELLSLVDYSTSGPAINSSLFPETLIASTLDMRKAPYWSASPFPTAAHSSKEGWAVNFYVGSIEGEEYTAAVRLVRGEQFVSNSAPGCTLRTNLTRIATGDSATGAIQSDAPFQAR